MFETFLGFVGLTMGVMVFMFILGTIVSKFDHRYHAERVIEFNDGYWGGIFRLIHADCTCVHANADTEEYRMNSRIYGKVVIDCCSGKRRVQIMAPDGQWKVYHEHIRSHVAIIDHIEKKFGIYR